MKSKKLFIPLLALLIFAAAFMPFGSMATRVHADSVITPLDIEVHWERKNMVETKTSRIIPNYSSDAFTDCAPLAGFSIVSYYDYNYTRLVAGDTHYYSDGALRYKSIYMFPEYDQLMSLMKTKNGETVNTEARRGLKKYFSNAGYTLTLSSAKSWGSLKVDKCVESFAAGRPVLLFIDGMKWTPLGTINEDTANKTDTFTAYTADVRHCVAAYGYGVLTYYTLNPVLGFDPVEGFYVSHYNEVYKDNPYFLINSGVDGWAYLWMNDDVTSIVSAYTTKVA